MKIMFLRLIHGACRGDAESDNKAFINGVLGCCHIFRRSSYMWRIIRATFAFVDRLVVYGSPEVGLDSGHAIVDTETSWDMLELLTYLVSSGGSKEFQ